MSRVFIELVALAVIAVIALQDIEYAPFRQETISQGLNGRGHVLLDAVFALLALGLVWVSKGHLLLQICASIAALGLVGISVTNTAWRWVDGLTGKVGGHERWHLMFTVVVFAGAAAFEVVGDFGGRNGLWALTAVNISVPLTIFLLSRRQDYAEKMGVLVMCTWLFAWAL